MAVSTIDPNGLNVGQLGGTRNVIINGAMKVAQRGTTSTGIGASSGYFTVDRYKMQVLGTTAGRLTMEQAGISDLPGFANCVKLSCTTADTSLSAGEGMIFRQMLEGQDVQQFAKGTSEAKQFAVSFYVKGNANATYTCELFDGDNARQISKTFSVTTDWTRVELIFPADTTGAFTDDNGISLYLQIFLSAGSDFTGGTFNSTAWAANVQANRVSSSQTNFFDSTSRTLFITGVQIEVGDTVTDFEHESYGTTLQKCQRYYYRVADGATNSLGIGFNYTSSHMFGAITFPVTMRTIPTLNAASGTNYYEFIRNGAADAFNSLGLGSRTTNKIAEIDNTTQISGTAGQSGLIRTDNAAVYVDFDAEL